MGGGGGVDKVRGENWKLSQALLNQEKLNE